MSDDYTGHLLEQLLDQNKAILEYVAEVPRMSKKLDVIGDKVEKLEQDMQVVKAAVTDLSNHQANHERRITRLKAA
jgi:SMC interacting uncharacterized protein involved in chromosome segregation